MHKILISDKLGNAGLARLDQYDDVTYDVKTGLSPEDLAATIGDYDALIIRSGTRVTADLLAAAKNLRVIGRAGIGVDNVDLDAATHHGVIVMNTPRANSIATAEQTIALMLAISRYTAQAHASLSAGEWARSKFVGTELSGKTLGIVGFGYIGRLVAERLKAFGMNIIAYDPYVSETVGREYDVTLVDLEDLLAQADYITLHSIITPETINMIDDKAIEQMKDGVIIVNVARGKLIDETALAKGLQNGKVAAAAIDVYQQEPPQDSPLIGLSNVLHTPHLGASSKEAQREVAIQIVDQVIDALRGVDYRNTVNVSFPPGLDFTQVRPYMSLAEKIGKLQSVLNAGELKKVEIEVSGDTMGDMVRPVASALLKGLMGQKVADINEINAPLIAQEQGVEISQAYGLQDIGYTNLISCRVHWKNGSDKTTSRQISGVLFGGVEPRIVQIDDFRLEARPEGVVLFMVNQDVPGVIGRVATILATYDVNIAEWRLGRVAPGGKALSIINLDSEPPEEALNALGKAAAVTQLKLIRLNPKL